MVRKSNKKRNSRKRCPKGSRRSSSGKTCRKSKSRKKSKSRRKSKSRKKSKSRRKSKSRSGGLTRWFGEKWVNVCKKRNGKYVSCGRKKASGKKYPYCRPLKRVNSKTPMTVGEMIKKHGKSKIKKMCKKKSKKKRKTIYM
tara:strand:+ start:476 stop:898 length:423 start_codon:yes stop_codon:yes gene_type:complete